MRTLISVFLGVLTIASCGSQSQTAEKTLSEEKPSEVKESSKSEIKSEIEESVLSQAVMSEINDFAPFLMVDNVSGFEGQEIAIPLLGFDLDGNALTYSFEEINATLSESGSVAVIENGVFRWTPNYNSDGTYLINYSVSDGANSVTESREIQVDNTNRTPWFDVVSSRSISTGQTVSITISARDSDQNGLTLTNVSGLPLANASFSSGSATNWDNNGILGKQILGTLTFTPSGAQQGSYTFTFQIADQFGASSVQSVIVTVNNTNAAPVLSPIGPKSGTESTAMSFAVSATDANSNPITYSASGLPSGAAFNAATRTFDWTPSCTQAGSYNVTFTVTDGSLSQSEVVAITIAHKNCGMPVFQNHPSIISSSGNQVVIDIGNGLDSDGAVTYGFTGVEFDCNNKNWTESFNPVTRRLTITNTYGAGDYGSHWFLVYVQDSDGNRAYRQVKAVGSVAESFTTGVRSGESTAGLCGKTRVYQH